MGLAWIPLKGHVSHKWTVMSNMCGRRLGPMLGEVPASSLCLDTALLPAPDSECKDRGGNPCHHMLVCILVLYLLGHGVVRKSALAMMKIRPDCDPYYRYNTPAMDYLQNRVSARTYYHMNIVEQHCPIEIQHELDR